MRIVFICNEYSPRKQAGIGTFVQTAARGLFQRGHDVTVVGLGDANEESLDQGIHLFMFRSNNLPFVGNLLSRLKLRSWISRYVKSRQVDVVEVPDSLGLLPFGIDGCAVVVRLHMSFTVLSRVTGQKGGRGISFYERLNVATNKNWIAVSEYLMDLTRSTFGITPNRSVVIHNPGAQVPSYLPDIPDLPSNFVLYAGRVCRLKGADILARAMRNVMAKRPNIHLVYVGGLMNADGRPMSDHIREIVGPQLSERVHFLGHVSREKVLTCMTRAKVFAYPSHLEGFPFVILEAMSCGAPVVYTKYPPGPEIIDDGVNGLLADPASPEDFSEKISRILDNPSFSYQLGENARRRVVEQFSVDKCVEATERFYEACLKTGSSPNRVGGM